jgi:hypothetical protein
MGAYFSIALLFYASISFQSLVGAIEAACGGRELPYRYNVEWADRQDASSPSGFLY